jgi:hypothetical protein
MASLSHEEFAMNRFGLVGLLAVFAAFVSVSSNAQAQVPGQLYTSPNGSSAACSAGTPCQLAVAIDDGPDGSIVSCINGGNAALGASIGTKSITIDCPGGVLTTGGDFFFNIVGPSSQIVILRNLTFEGRSGCCAPYVHVTGGATVIIENCKFENVAAGNAIAIQFQPTSPAAQLIIRDSVFVNNGIAPGTGGGLQVAPAAGGSASVVLERVSFNLNSTAMALSGPVNVTMINSTVSASRSNGILVGSGATLDIEDSKLVYNVGAAVSVSSGGTVRLSNTSIKSNQIGVKNSGGQALSYKNNRIVANGSTATLGTITGGQ